MNLEQAFQISLVDFLARLGHQPTKVKGQKYWYLAPYRNERTASFNVNMDKNRWYDFGTGEGGGIILLAKRIYQTNDTSLVLRMIEEQSPLPVSRHNKPPCNKGAEWVNVTVLPLRSYPLFDYLIRRGIPINIGARFCCEISYELRGKRYYSIGFPNDSGGYELRNPYFKGCMGKKNVSFLKGKDNPKAKKRICHLFEGIFDLLSYFALLDMGIFHESDDEQSDYIVLNSVSNLNKVLKKLDSYDRILTYLDNDDAGKKTTEVLIGCYGQAVHDVSFIFDFHNDLNDYLCSIINDRKGK